MIDQVTTILPDYEQFVNDVKEMRRWQRTLYATTNDPDSHKHALKRSKEYERRVDAHLKPFDTTPKQEVLF